MLLALILSAVVLYLLSGAAGVHALRRDRDGSLFLSIVLFVLAFVTHTSYLGIYSRQFGRCPATTPSEILVFIAWAIALNYLVLGSTYRVSILGWLTSPTILGMLTLAHFTQGSSPTMPTEKNALWALEFHAGISLLAYGTLGLAAIAAGVSILSNHSLKQKSALSIRWLSLPLGKLDKVTFRVGLWGWLLLLVGIASGFWVPGWGLLNAKVIWGIGIGLLYGMWLGMRWRGRLSPVRFAWIMVLNYAFVLVTFLGMNAWLN